MATVKITKDNYQEFEGVAAFRCADCGRDVRRKAPAYVSPTNLEGNYLAARSRGDLLECKVCQKRRSRIDRAYWKKIG